MSMRTPLKSVRRLGSAKEGANHFWQQRVTAVANMILGLFLVWLIASVAGQELESIKIWLANPLIAISLLLLISSGVYHMRLGMQVIIEDYISSEVSKIVFLMLNTFFAIAVGLASAFAIFKINFGA